MPENSIAEISSASLEQRAAAEAYNNEFSNDKSLQRQEKLKRWPVIGPLINRDQARTLSIAERSAAAQMDYDIKLDLLNARGLNERLTEAAAKLSRENVGTNGESWVVIFCDINWFKKFNDQLGQTDGDEYLKGVASVLRNNVRNREGDLVARHGGEEFVVVLRLKPETDVDAVLWGGDSQEQTGVLGRVGAGIKELRDSWIKQHPEKFGEKIIDSEGEFTLEEMGVGTLSAGIEYLYSTDVAKRYREWVEAVKSKKTAKDFVNYTLIDSAQTVMKQKAKQEARFNQKPLVTAIVGVN